MMQRNRQNVFDVSRIRPRLGGLPHLETFTWKHLPRLRGLRGLADRATQLGGSPHPSCKRDQIRNDKLYEKAGNPTLSGYLTSMLTGPLAGKVI